MRLGKNLTAVALGFSSGSSEYSSPVFWCCTPIPCHSLTDFCFSRDAVAKKASSWDQLTPQMILEWASFNFLKRVNWSSLVLWKRAQDRSLEQETRYWSHFENSSCTTVRVWAESLQEGTEVWPFLKSQMMMSAYFLSLALLALAAQSP